MQQLVLVGAVGLGIIVAAVLVFAVVYIIYESVRESLRFSYTELRLPPGKDPGALIGELAKRLALRGLEARPEGGAEGAYSLLVDGSLVRHRVRVIDGLLAYWAEPTGLALGLGIALLVISIVLSAIVALFAYIQYDNQRRVLRAALAEVLGGQAQVIP